MAYRDELFEKLKQRRPDVAQDDTAKEIEKNLQQIQQLKMTNIEAARNQAKHALQLIQKHANELEQKKTYRNAAQQYYVGFQLIHELFSDPTQERNWLLKTAQMLELAAEHYLQWGEIDDAMAAKVIATLIRILTGDWNVASHLDAFKNKVDFNNPKAQAARGIIYIPYDIIQAIQTLDPQYLHRAESYIQGYLKAVQSSQHFYTIIDTALNFVKQEFMKKVKLPRLITHVKYSQDLVFGEDFDFTFTVRNDGEGIAKEVTLTLTLPPQLTLMGGSLEKTVPQLNPGESTSISVKLNCPSGEGQPQITLDVTSEVQYRDILNNIRTSLHGPYEVIIRATKKSEELLEELSLIQETQKELLTKLNADVPSNNVKKLSLGLTTFYDNLIKATKERIAEEDFEAAEALMITLKDLTTVFEPTVAFLGDYILLMRDTLKFLEENNARTRELQEKLKTLADKAKQTTTPKIP